MDNIPLAKECALESLAARDSTDLLFDDNFEPDLPEETKRRIWLLIG